MSAVLPGNLLSRRITRRSLVCWRGFSAYRSASAERPNGDKRSGSMWRKFRCHSGCKFRRIPLALYYDPKETLYFSAFDNARFSTARLRSVFSLPQHFGQEGEN